MKTYYNGGNSGVNKLARTIQNRMKNSRELIRSPLDYGLIQNDMSLLTNNFPQPIPQGDYMVCRSVAWGSSGSVLYDTSPEEIKVTLSDGTLWKDKHCHSVYINEKTRFKSGDRVLVAWIGSDPCVIDVILPATSIC